MSSIGHMNILIEGFAVLVSIIVLQPAKPLT